ncbi:molybdate ABC transporter substrate-binding protein [Ramlibacter alkalitolerans]|uniref:Substrate-binding domain-containing protein n=1 Tax=Ramlibacter alkalitolerans TaxID=2039631 RepID=A0ABS1JLG5_9BURK|nr:substrate-binding domain-containing protein [Ramlibacter alkalitolerans]MBL0424756.1 substrate-binding domain-containing protein [Ramlibacter alkalitolerans]
MAEGRALRVLCAGAVKAPFSTAAARFEQATGTPVTCSFGAVGSLRERLASGEPADLVVLSKPVLETLRRQGLVREDHSLGCVGVGLAVRTGCTLPDVSSPELLRETLLRADSLAYGDPQHGDSSGMHFASVLEKLGIAAAMRGRTQLAESGLQVVDWVATGRVAMGATPSSVIRSSAHVTLAAMLPPSLQNQTEYVCALLDPAATGLMAYVQQPESRRLFADAGLLPAPA